MAFKSPNMSGVSIDRLNTLCAVVDAGTIVAAAGPDLNRQSQFSRQLKLLETALGATLFERSGKTLKANKTGLRVARAAQIFFCELDDVIDVTQKKAETIRLGADEASLRWFIMPHLPELNSGDPPLRFEVHSLTTESALRELLAGSVDLVVVRTDSVPDDMQSKVVKTIQYVLAVPRTLLRSREAAEVFKGRPLPFAELTGDGHFARTVETTATTLGLNLRVVFKAQTFSLLFSAVESGTAAAFLPEVAAKSLPELNFAIVSAKGMSALHCRLNIAWIAQVFESRPAVRRAISCLRRVLA